MLDSHFQDILMEPIFWSLNHSFMRFLATFCCSSRHLKTLQKVQGNCWAVVKYAYCHRYLSYSCFLWQVAQLLLYARISSNNRMLPFCSQIIDLVTGFASPSSPGGAKAESEALAKLKGCSQGPDCSNSDGNSKLPPNLPIASY